jgi:hypothetical protein
VMQLQISAPGFFCSDQISGVSAAGEEPRTRPSLRSQIYPLRVLSASG